MLLCTPNIVLGMIVEKYARISDLRLHTQDYLKMAFFRQVGSKI